MWLLFSFVAMAALAPFAGSTEVDCGSGRFCHEGEGCTTDMPNAGFRFACSPAVGASTCSDIRFSCEAGRTCDLLGGHCLDPDGAKVSPVLHNTDARSALRAGESSLFCDAVRNDLPASCTCQSKSYGGTLTCEIGVLSDKFGLRADIDPCGDDAHVNLKVFEAKLGVDFEVAGIHARQTQEIPVPGLGIGIPDVGDAGVVIAVQIKGSLESFSITLGVDACIIVFDKRICGSRLTKELPFWILNGWFKVDGICKTTAAEILV